MKCEHEPLEKIAAFCHVCAKCGVEIEYVPCPTCTGYGFIALGDKCQTCNGTGVEKWEELK